MQFERVAVYESCDVTYTMCASCGMGKLQTGFVRVALCKSCGVSVTVCVSCSAV